MHSWLVPYRVELVEPDPAWPGLFESLARGIGDALGPLAVRIEHIGSTSVPGLPAKPVIDIQLSLRSLDPWAPYGEPLAALGYVYRADDDAPEEHRFFRLSAEARSPDTRAREGQATRAPGPDEGSRVANLHACRAASEWERRHLSFRDHLRAHPALTGEYAALKRRVAAEFPQDVHAYTAAKTPFIRRIEQLALGRTATGPAEPVVVVPHDPGWQGSFEREAARIRAALRGRAPGVEHIGSTAVPGLAARPVVDILVATRSLESRADSEERLAWLGYHAAAAGPFLVKGRPATHQLALATHGGERHRLSVALRDYLRARPDQAARFGRLKSLLAGELGRDPAGYEEGKALYVWVIEQRMKEEGFAAG